MFLICTIANNPTQYASMKESFLQAGFDEEQCHYYLFDNSRSNFHDPYHVISTVMAQAAEPYVIFCHQDVLVNKEHGFDQLVDQIDTLNKRDAAWAIAGNAGGTEDMSLVMTLTDPYGQWHNDELPQKVHSLDENFLLLKTASQLRCSPELHGFHFYGLDLCLNAMRKHNTCYVINFHLTHMSAGNTSSDDFAKALERFKAAWNPRFTLCLIKTTCAFFGLSRYALVRLLLKQQRILSWIVSHIRLYKLCSQYSRPRTKVRGGKPEFLSCS